jgi:F0F1-type ATP synthase alpha subunit
MLTVKYILRSTRSHSKSHFHHHGRFLSVSSKNNNIPSSPLHIDESPDVLLDMLEGNDSQSSNEGIIRSVDVVNGIALCSGLKEAKVGDLVQLEGGKGMGVVLSLEEYSVRLGVLQGNARTGNNVTMKPLASSSSSHKVGDQVSDHFRNLSGSQINPLGSVLGPKATDQHATNANATAAYVSSFPMMEEFVSKASRHWRTWPSKLSERTSTRHVIEKSDQCGTIFTGIPALDTLCPIRRGGSMIISGPQKNSTHLATKIANNFLSSQISTNSLLKDNNRHRQRRVIYVNMSHNDSSLIQLAKDLGIEAVDPANNGNRQHREQQHHRAVTLIGAPLNSTKSGGGMDNQSNVATFCRTLAPYVGIELGEHAAKHNQEDVLVIIDEVCVCAFDSFHASVYVSSFCMYAFVIVIRFFFFHIIYF